ncbi:copper chaperone CopZ [Staphylococcus aureus]|nr:copper chaperone CopZ [Staphylococcus aureus]
MSQEILNVEGMSCGHCKSAVESALNNIDGVTSADVNLENGQVSVQYDDSKVAVSQMKDAIEDQGYNVVLIRQYSTSSTPN